MAGNYTAYGAEEAKVQADLQAAADPARPAGGRQPEVHSRGPRATMSDAVEIAPGIHQLDTLLGGMDQLTAGFLVEGRCRRSSRPVRSRASPPCTPR